MAKFNLLEEPWIPVLREGQVQEVGLREVLLKAHRITRIETPSPLEEIALHRLLLAILYRALPSLRDSYDVLDLWDRGELDRSRLEAYLDRFHDRFYLFHETAPFLQIPDLPEEKPLPWSKLLPELASGNNPTLFDHTTKTNLTPSAYAQVARALLVHQGFALGETLRRMRVSSASDAPIARPAGFLVVGKNLFQTLLLNLVPPTPKEEALWELPPLRAKDVEGHATQWPLAGASRVYVWPARGVQLLDTGGGVREMAYGPGVKPREVGWRDPMVAYGLDKKKGQIFPLRLSMEKSFWRDFGALLPAAGGSWPGVLVHASRMAEEIKLRPRVRVLGQVSDQAKVLDIRREVYPLPRNFLCSRGELLLQKALELAEGLGAKLQGVARRLAQALLGDRDPAELQAFQKSLPLLRLYWAELDGAFPRFLDGLEGLENLDGWRDDLRRAAQRAWGETRHFLGTEGRHLKALAEGERAFGKALASLKEEVKG